MVNCEATMIILTYHAINEVENFEDQINHLVHNNYNILSLSDFIDGYANRKLKSKDVLITFDDGDYSVLKYAFPILTKYSCPAALFVITSLIDTKYPYWWDEILYYTNDKKQVVHAKSLTNNERLDFLERLRSTSNRARLQHRQLTLQELKVMEQGRISIANHSHTHPMLDKLSTNEIKYELSTSSAYLKDNGLPHHNIFAYPNGNYTEASEKILRDLEIKLAFLFDHKLNSQYVNPFRISRLSVNDSTPLWKFKLILSGWHSQIAPITKKIHKLIS